MSSSRFQELLKNQRLNPETSRAGLKWDAEDYNNLIKKAKEGVDIDEIAKILKRTSGSIKTRLIVYALDKIEKDNVKKEDAIKMVNITENDIDEYKEKRDKLIEKKQNKINFIKKDDDVVNNKVILKYLKEISAKLDKM